MIISKATVKSGLGVLVAALGALGCGSVESVGNEPTIGELGAALQDDHHGEPAEEHEGKEHDCELPESENSKKPMTVAVYGDLPYGTKPTDVSQTDALPGFIQSVNNDPNVSLVLHVGDIHSGKQYCTEAYDRAIASAWSAFADPVVYTPGDNEWSDCHKPAEGGGVYNTTTGQIDYVVDSSGSRVDYAGGDPIANLELVRRLFFPKPARAFGGRKHVLSQSQCAARDFASDAKYVENVMWRDSSVLFVTLNIPGGSNNDKDIWYGAPTMSDAQATEIAERTAADLRWLDRAFAEASHSKAKGIVIVAQADMWDPEKGAAHQAGYEPFVQSIATHALAFGKPVLMLNGDSHVYQSSNPLSSSDPLAYMHPGYNVPNVHRVVVHGSTAPLEYLRLSIDPKANAPHGTEAFGPFSWTRVLGQ